MCSGVRIQDEFVRIESVTRIRLVRPVYPHPVHGSRMNIGNVAVPKAVGVLGQRNAFDLRFPLGVEQTHFDLRGISRKQGEVSAAPVPDRAMSFCIALFDATGLPSAHLSISRTSVPRTNGWNESQFRTDTCARANGLQLQIGRASCRERV